MTRGESLGLAITVAFIALLYVLVLFVGPDLQIFSS